MANTSSAKKMVKVIEKRSKVNRMRRSKARTLRKKAEASFLIQNKELAKLNFNLAMSELHKCVNKKIFHKNTVARIISNMNKKLKHCNLREE